MRHSAQVSRRAWRCGHQEKNLSELERQFEAKVRAALRECHQLGYHAHDFESMLTNASAVKVAEKLVVSGDIQSGLKRLAQMGRPDLSVEAMMLEPQFELLFAKSLRDAARWRLEQVRSHA